MVLRSVDPNRQAVEAARVRAEATAAVLEAQRVAAQATEDAARSGERLGTERSEWERQRAVQRTELEELRTAVASARERAVSTRDALDAALAAHRADLEGRDHNAARVAAAHEEETSGLLQESPARRSLGAPAHQLLVVAGAGRRPRLHSPTPDHPLFDHLEIRDCTWHYHGVLDPPAGAQVLVALPTGEALLYVDEVSTAGTLVVATLDPLSHYGGHFMPATERFLDGFLPWAAAVTG